MHTWFLTNTECEVLADCNYGQKFKPNQNLRGEEVMAFDGIAIDQVIKNLAMKVNAAALTWAPGRQERMYYLTNTQPSTNRGMHWVAMVAEITKQGDESTAATRQPQKQPTPVSQEENMIVRRPPDTGPPKTRPARSLADEAANPSATPTPLNEAPIEEPSQRSLLSGVFSLEYWEQLFALFTIGTLTQLFGTFAPAVVDPYQTVPQAYAQGEEVLMAFGAERYYAPAFLTAPPKIPQISSTVNTGVAVGLAAATGAAAIFHRQGGSQKPNPWFLLGKNPPDIPTHDRAAPTDKPPAPKKETSPADGTRFGQKDPRSSPAGGPRSPSMPGASGQGPSFSPSPVPQSQDFRATLETSMDMNTSSSH